MFNIKNILISLLVSSCFIVVSAESSTKINSLGVNSQKQNTTAILIADVNFSNVETSTKNEMIDISFSIKSSLGSISNVTYGIIVMSTAQGGIIDSFTVAEKLLLLDGDLLSKNFSYKIPTTLQESGDIYLVAYNERGLSLALVKVGNVKKGISEFICERTSNDVSCFSKKDTVLNIDINESVTQGKKVGTTTVIELKKDTKYTQSLKSLTAQSRAGVVVVTFNAVGVDGVSFGKYIYEYIKEGDIARIVSVIPETVASNKNVSLKVITYTNIQQSSPKIYTISNILANNCGSNTVSLNGDITTSTIVTKCTSGEMETTLSADGVIVDSVHSRYSLPGDGVLISPNLNTSNKAIGLIAIIFVVISGVYFYRKKSSTSLVKIVALLFFVSIIPQFSHINAATYTIGAPLYYQSCTGPGSSWVGNVCTGSEPNESGDYLAYTTAGTVTVPNSVAPNQVYSVNITHSISFPNTKTHCWDGATEYVCLSDNIFTDLYRNLPVQVYNSMPQGSSGAISVPGTATLLGTRPTHSPSGTINVTSPSSGANDNLQFLQSAFGTTAVGCIPAGVACWTYQDSVSGISVPISAPSPTVQINFSLLDTIKSSFKNLLALLNPINLLDRTFADFRESVAK